MLANEAFAASLAGSLRSPHGMFTENPASVKRVFISSTSGNRNALKLGSLSSAARTSFQNEQRLLPASPAKRKADPPDKKKARSVNRAGL